ncbi:small conductance mechanosensitive ion channel family [Dorcoceras hygrometricum]|uniref:Small conductance mechanosensitive ion channel family n=1 Tax=Dorcoceras hygrometricum TaxID=472368 RepID=A0A2Z7CM53_9LAMI|nr:small conductance mechanosensitive ion channel family [Dorcoceras hygrometricum]
MVSNLLPISEQILCLSCSPSWSASEFFWINAELVNRSQSELRVSQDNSTAGNTNNSGHGACESVVAIHSSQHAVPEAKIQLLNPLCPTHESVVAIHSSHSPPKSIEKRSMGVLMITLLATRAWLRPVSRGNRHFTVGGGRLRQSGPRPEARLLRQSALEGMTRSARTDSPRQVGRNKFRRSEAAAAFEERREAAT